MSNEHSETEHPGKPMVGWFDLAPLARTAVQVAISTIFGKSADFRMLEALRAPQDVFEEKLDDTAAPVWIDYVGDTGDGWNSTYAVAYWMTRPELAVAVDGEGTGTTTSPGQILIFGGDQVYPTASRGEYETRLVAPYEAARKHTDAPHPQLYAIPGNHDWYDNLVSFTRLFCGKEWFAGWKTPQKRSYFALNLPHGWWLIGTDIQLGSDIDEEQLKYFRDAAAKMGPDDRVIVCTAEPHWIFAEAYRESDPQYYSDKTLSFLETKVFAGKIQVFLAGDLHHYRRHEADGQKQKITSGGGGAFLHPTHGAAFEELHQDLAFETPEGEVTRQHTHYRKRASYPDVPTSARLAWRNLLFPLLNPTFGFGTGLLYLLCAWAVLPKIEGTPSGASVLREVLIDPLATLLFVLVITAFIFFTDTHSKLHKRLGGTMHGIAHIMTAILAGLGASRLAELWTNTGTLTHLLSTAALTFVAGWLAGPFIFGLYLLISLNALGRHSNEAFSSLKIEDYKNFIRMRIDPDGTLTIFPIGIEKVPRGWKKTEKPNGPAYEPAGDFTKPILIEEPLRIGGAGAEPKGGAAFA